MAPPAVPAIIPDDKDWTWVLHRPCLECGYDASSVDPADLPDRIRATIPRWEAVLGREGARLRPRADVWSPLEYGCHVRDVFALYDFRLGLMLTQDDPAYPNWDQDETAIAADYGGQDPALVAQGLADAGERVAAAFEGVRGDQWSRTGLRSDGAHLTVEQFGRYFLHDVVHHLHDVSG